MSPVRVLPDPDPFTGFDLQSWMREHGLTDARLGSMLGISRQSLQYYRYYCGRQLPKKFRWALYGVARKLDIPFSCPDTEDA